MEKQMASCRNNAQVKEVSFKWATMDMICDLYIWKIVFGRSKKILSCLLGADVELKVIPVFCNFFSGSCGGFCFSCFQTYCWSQERQWYVRPVKKFSCCSNYKRKEFFFVWCTSMFFFFTFECNLESEKNVNIVASK